MSESPKLGEANLQAIHEMIDNLINKLMSHKKIRENTTRSELFSEAWMTTLDLIPCYQKDKGTKLTTYLWSHLYWKLTHYAQKRSQQHSQEEEFNPNLHSTESRHGDDFMQGNPYQNSPDGVLEEKEKCFLWAQLQKRHPQSCELCLTSTHHATSTQRARLSKRRKQVIPMLQQELSNLL